MVVSRQAGRYAPHMPNPVYPGETGHPVEVPEASSVNHVVATSAANTALNVDVAAPTDATQAHYLSELSIGWTGTTPTAAVLVTIESPNGTVRRQFVLGVGPASVGLIGSSPLKMPDGGTVRVAVPAGSAGAIARVSLHYYTR